MPRKYKLKQRAEEQAETRQRIVDATIALHQTRGDAGTTIIAIAERAGVGRVTVYRHFPDERALLTACTGHYLAQNPPPDPGAWSAITDPEQRLRSALGQVYGWYRRNEAMLAQAEADAPSNPILADLLAPLQSLIGAMREVLLEGRETSGDTGRQVGTAIGLALAFGTWRSLSRDQVLDDAAAAALMLRLVGCAALESSAEGH